MSKASLRALALILLFAVVGSSCGDDGPEWTPLPPLDYGVAPTPVDAEAFETATPIKHVVFVIKENRTFDNMFGLFPGGLFRLKFGRCYGQDARLAKLRARKAGGQLESLGQFCF